MIRFHARSHQRAFGALFLLFALGATRVPSLGAPPPAVQPTRPTPPGKKTLTSTKTCSPPTGDPIPAEKVMQDLAEGKNVDLTGRTIEGSLDADAYWAQSVAEKRATFRVVRGRLKLESCRITGRMAFPRCIFLQDISLACTEVLGDLDMADSEVRGGIAGEKLRVVGDMRLSNGSFDRDILFRSGVFESRVDLTGARLHSVSFVDAEIARSFEMTHVSTSLMDLSSLKVSGPAKFEDVIALVGITAREATFGRGLTMNGVRVIGPMDLSDGKLGGDLTLTEVNVETDLSLPHLYEGPVTIADVTVGRNLVMADGEFREVSIERLTVKGASRLEAGRYAGALTIGDTDFGTGFRANETQFAGDCEFRRVKFPGPDPMRGAQFMRMPSLIDTKLPRIPTIVSDDGSKDSDDDDE